MALTTYNELKSAIANWTHRGDIATYCDDLVTLAEARINREVRSTEMETALSVTIASGVAAVPSGFLELRHAYVDGSPSQKLYVKSAADIYDKYPTRASTGKPCFIAYDAGNFIFGPYPDSNYTIKGTYFRLQGPLSSGTYTLFTVNPDLFLFAALAESSPFLVNDKRVQLWETKYRQIRDDVNTRSEGSRVGGGMAMSVA